MILVLDASVVLEILLRTEAGVALAPRVLQPGALLGCPHLIDLEVVQALRRYVRAGMISEQRAGEALEDLSALPLARYPHQPFLGRVWGLRGNLTAYDAAYVVLAETLGCKLLTRDVKLAAAPEIEPHVELVGDS